MMSSFSIVFADGYIPVFSSKPSHDLLVSDGVYYDDLYFGTNTDDAFYYYYLNTTANTYDYLLGTTNSSGKFYSTTTNGSTVVTLSMELYGSHRFYRVQGDQPITTNFPYLGSFSSVYESLSYYVSNGISEYPSDTPSTSSAKSYYSLQNGWLSVIDLGSSGFAYEFDLETTFQMNSGLLSGTWGDGTTQRYWFSDSLPDENTSYLSTFGNAIEWQKGYPRNVFGQTKNAICTISGTSAGRYLYILNPALQKIWDEQSPSINNHSMTISGLTEGISAKIYKLSATATLDGINNAVDITTVGTVSATDTSSDLTNGFINDDNENVVQNAGGGNENEVAQSVNGYLQGIQNALDNFVNQFIGLLSAPISHIQQMIESGSNFFSVFGQLFTWLPEEISVIITGSLLVMVIIGVFKMFL